MERSKTSAALRACQKSVSASARSSFDARNYGYSRLAELVEALPQLTTEKCKNTVFVKRVR